MADTLLVLAGIGVAPYSARGLTQTLELIAEAKGHIYRTIDGDDIDLTPAAFKKYKSSISCTDANAPAFDGLFPGTTVIVDCVKPLGYPVGGTPQRPQVEDSSWEDGGFVWYRPRLTMRVRDFKLLFNEYRAEIGWQLDLEER